MQNCIAPVFCRDRNGVCCLLVMDRGRFLCPITCVEPSASSRLQLFAYKLLNYQGNFTDYQDSTDTDESTGNLNYNNYDPYYNTEYETYLETYTDYYPSDVYDDKKSNIQEYLPSWDNYYHNYDQSDMSSNNNDYYHQYYNYHNVS